MPPKKKRLTRKDFPHLGGGTVVHSPHLTVRASVHEGESRFAVVTSSKVSNKAVVRNALRRQLYSALNSYAQVAKKGLNIAIFLKKGAAEVARADLRRELEELLRRAHIL